MRFQIFLLTALPMCLAQFTIQGPSDGNRRAQGLKFSQEKGLEYSEQADSEGPGDFTIQGATDGNSNFRIQGATDGHSDFNIQGATDGGAATYNIQGATDGHRQSRIQGPYDANTKALQYNDPSGLRVNWRSYNRQTHPREQVQYAAQAAAQPPQVVPRQRQAHRSPQPRAQQQQQQQAEPVPVYKPYNNAPPQIQQLLRFQQEIPYVNVIPEQYRFDAEAAIQEQRQLVQEHYRNLAKQSPAPATVSAPAPAPEPRQRSRVKSPSRQKRQTRSQQQQQQPQNHQQPYHRVYQPPAEPQPQYSTNLPAHLKQLLVYQAQIPYNIIANQITYRPDKPYVPHRVDSQQQQQLQQPQQPQQVQQAQYQGQGGAYEAQASTYAPISVGGYNQDQQYQLADYNQLLAYNQQQTGVRPVTENQH